MHRRRTSQDRPTPSIGQRRPCRLARSARQKRAGHRHADPALSSTSMPFPPRPSALGMVAGG
ncbi:hypothetical protein roselon_00359 [Roseibacterium elongatum DSM 19469]|uniref:Uncharacterized protein n=1 Tax=Roseicyclus elongatus DSM 19469 TaxID=1294273 RepID=W8RNS7_9RHOB|nr:hypothetical protein roselon_00359 [Roseibacterium elongatum DSM 19469]